MLTLTLGWCLWAIAVTDSAMVEVGPFSVAAVATIAIGVAMWPGRLPWSRIRPRSLGAGIGTYG